VHEIIADAQRIYAAGASLTYVFCSGFRQFGNGDYCRPRHLRSFITLSLPCREQKTQNPLA
jgi:hypothetical protein